MRRSFIILSAGACLASCIHSEALNSEADITACSFPADILLRDPVITDNKVTVYVKDEANLTRLAPEFALTDGATIEPPSGTFRDFTLPQTYVVTSEDGKWTKTYTVECVFSNPLTEAHFEHVTYYEFEGRQYYHIFTDTTADGTEFEWGSGNEGFLVTRADAAPEEYPTCQDENGYSGKCAKLTTCSTGTLGAMFNAPIAAGNLFIGTFDISLSNPAKSTHMGIPFRQVPVSLSGYYKYSAGPVFTDKSGQKAEGRQDIYDIYAVFFEATEDAPYLDGTNVKTSGQIVSIAQIPADERKETDEWTRFSIPFQLLPGKSIDSARLRAGGYSLTIVLTSSENGADFEGAVGSTLYADELRLFYESGQNE